MTWYRGNIKRASMSPLSSAGVAFFSRIGPFRLRAALFSVLTALVLSILPASYWFSRADQVNRDTSHQIEHTAEAIAAHMKQRLQTIELMLRGVKGFVEGSDAINASEFHDYVASLRIESSAPDVLSVAFVPYVTADHLGRFSSRVEQEISTELFKLRPSGQRDAYAPVLFIEPPTAGNTRLRGRDILTIPATREAALRARDRAGGSLSGRISLAEYGVGEDDSDSAFVMYQPIYKSDAVGDTGVPSHRSFVGWAAARFRLKDVLESHGPGLHPGLRLQVFDGEREAESGFLFGMLDDRSEPFHSVGANPHEARGAFDYGGRRWTYTVTPTASYQSGHTDRVHHWLASLGILLSLAAGFIVWLLMTSRDRAQQLAVGMNAELRAISSDLEGTLNAVPDLLFEFNAEGRFLALRTATDRFLAFPKHEVVGKSVFEVLPVEAAEVCMKAIEAAHRDGTSSGQLVEVRVRGERRWYELSVARKSIEVGAPSRFVMLARDITARRAAEEKVRELAFFDHLTGQPNRSQFMLTASKVLTERKLGQVFGVALLVDLDNFKAVNDHWGHHRGDQLLVQIAQRISRELQPGDMLARLGGDEFIVLIEDLGSDKTLATQRVEALSARLLATISRPIVIEGQEYFSSASLGAVLFGHHPMSVEDLLSQADSAMYYAKDSGRNTFRFFDSRLQKRISERVELEADLRQSIEHKELFLLYQPQIEGGGRIIGAEALCRWRNPSRGEVSPAEFISLAESTGFIQELGPWVLETACNSLANWCALPGMEGVTLSVNVSARQFHHPDFVRQVLEVIKRTSADPAKLKLELTESIFAGDLDEIVTKMSALKARGIRFSLDDFGTGYSSLAYLKKLPLDQLKIDKSFVRDVLNNRNDEAIIRTVIALGKSLRLSVMAEGVETEEQHAFLQRSGCVLYQGYLFGRPMTEEALLMRVSSIR
ncbi:EAL domain-containing protein [bacterium BD-1]|nr:EAL domain-containing protein [Ottowia caeni]